MIALFAYRSFKKWQKGENLFEDDCESIDNCAEDSIFYDFKQIKSFENQLKTAKNDKNGKEEPFKEMKKKIEKNEIPLELSRKSSEISEFFTFSVNSIMINVVTVSYYTHNILH